MIAAAIHLVSCMIVFSMLERFWPSATPHRWWRRPLLVDICSWLIVPVAIGAGITLAILLTNALVQNAHLWPWLMRLRTGVGQMPLLVQMVVAFVAVDILSYWLHRAYHRLPFLWSFHVMHHTSAEVDWLSSLRVHPLSQMIDNALMAILLLIPGLSPKAVIAANALVGFLGVLTHASVPWTFGRLGRLFVSPVFHHWHHARPEAPSQENAAAANFGAALSIWDWIFRTAREARRCPRQFGADQGPAADLGSLLLQPLRFCKDRFSGTFRRSS